MEKEQQQIIEKYNNLVDKYNNTLKENIKLKDDSDKMTMILEEIAEKKRKGEFSTNTIDFCLKKAEAKRKNGYKKTA